MMQPVELRDRSDVALVARLYQPRYGRVVIERLVCARLMIVLEVRCQNSMQMCLGQDDHMVETLPANGSD